VRVDVNAVLAVAGQLVTLLIGLGALYVGLRRWVERVAGAPARAAAEQLQTSNGTTVAGYVEALAKDVGELKTAHATTAEQASTALTLARHTSDRLDAHLSGHDKHTT